MKVARSWRAKGGIESYHMPKNIKKRNRKTFYTSDIEIILSNAEKWPSFKTNKQPRNMLEEPVKIQ